MGKKVIIVGLVAMMLCTGGAVYAQDILTLSVGTGAYGRYMFSHETVYGQGVSFFDSIKTYKLLSFGAPITLRAELFRFLGVDASAYYLRNIYESGVSGDNDIRAVFSLYGQLPIEISGNFSLLPFLGVGYDMFIFSWQGSDSYSRKDLKNWDDDLLAKLGLGFKWSLTNNLRLDIRLVEDILLYNRFVLNEAKEFKNSGLKLFVLQQAPSLFVGMGFEFLKI